MPTITLQTDEILLPPDSIRRIEVRPPRGTSFAPILLFVPEPFREEIKVKGFSVVNAGHEVPFFMGRDFFAELFDDTPGRDVPYSKLPRVPADPDTLITLTVWNPTLKPRRFQAEVRVETP